MRKPRVSARGSYRLAMPSRLKVGIFFLAIGILALVALVLQVPPPTARTTPSTSSPVNVDATEMMHTLLQGSDAETAGVLARIRETKDTRFVAPLIELLFADRVGVVQNVNENELRATLEAVSGQSFGPDWASWIEWYGDTNVQPPPGFTGWKGKLYSRIDPRFADFLRDDAPNRTRVEEIVWGGVRVDGIPALDNPKFISAKEATYLQLDEPVFGVFINGDGQAYLQRILDWHEMANDVVGGIPISLAY